MSKTCEKCGYCKLCGQTPCKDEKKTGFKKKDTECFVCHKRVKKVLDLCSTGADLCSLDCNETYWLDILY